MFCEKCGAELPNGACFCPNCGVAIEEVVSVDDTLLFKMKPVFKFFYVEYPAIVFECILGCVLGIIFSLLQVKIELEPILVFSSIMVAIILGNAWIQKKQYDGISYEFYRKKVIFKDTFLRKTEEEIRYTYIRNISFRQNFLEKLLNIGTINLWSDYGSAYIGFIQLRHISNVEETCEKLKKLIGL